MDNKRYSNTEPNKIEIKACRTLKSPRIQWLNKYLAAISVLANPITCTSVHASVNILISIFYKSRNQTFLLML